MFRAASMLERWQVSNIILSEKMTLLKIGDKENDVLNYEVALDRYTLKHKETNPRNLGIFLENMYV